MSGPRSRHFPPELPGAIVLREALRTLRHVAREGRDAVADASGHAAPPVAGIAKFAISGADSMAEAASELAGRILGVDQEAPARLGDLPPGDANANCFAAASYSALRQILPHLGARHALVSELTLRRAFRDTPALEEVPRAVALYEAMHRLGAIQDVEIERASPVTVAEAERLALFAVLLWMLSDRDAGDAGIALESAVMLTLAIREDVMASGDDGPAVGKLFEEFRHHV